MLYVGYIVAHSDKRIKELTTKMQGDENIIEMETRTLRKFNEDEILSMINIYKNEEVIFSSVR